MTAFLATSQCIHQAITRRNLGLLLLFLDIRYGYSAVVTSGDFACRHVFLSRCLRASGSRFCGAGDQRSMYFRLHICCFCLQVKYRTSILRSNGIISWLRLEELIRSERAPIARKVNEKLARLLIYRSSNVLIARAAGRIEPTAAGAADAFINKAMAGNFLRQVNVAQIDQHRRDHDGL